MSKAIRRLGRERVENAFECLKDCLHAEGDSLRAQGHKKVPAVLRLVRSGIAKTDSTAPTGRVALTFR